MAKEEDIKNLYFQAVIEEIRNKHPETIDKAYEYFWDGNLPDEFLSGTALDLGFVNFEDWLICDYKVNEDKETFLDLHLKTKQGLAAEELKVIKQIRSSVLSLYEVSSVSKDKRVVIKDLLLNGNFSLRDRNLSKGLKKGDLFATRLLNLDGNTVMSGCVYPFSSSQKKKILGHIDKQFGRYKRNVNPEGIMEEFLKDFGDVFNIMWMSFFLAPTVQEA